MLRFLKATWLATLVFAALSRLEVSRYGWMVYFGPTVTALAVVPPVWWWFVARRGRPRIGRAALAGATSAFLIHALAWVALHAWSEMRPSRYVDGWGDGLGNLELLFVVVFSALIGGPVGAGAGALVAFVQTRCWPYPPEKHRPADSMLDGALRGAMVATLAAPFVAILAVVLLSLTPMRPSGAPSLGILFSVAWLVLVPTGAQLGMRRVRRIAATRRASTTAKECAETLST